MAISYEGGAKFSLAGIPAAKISEHAREYVKANRAAIGATEANVTEAWGIESRLTGSNLAQRLSSLEANRAYALKGKSGAAAEKINHEYDLVLAYYGVRAEMLAAQSASTPFAFPLLQERLSESVSTSAEGIAATLPAGAWRKQAQGVAEQNKQAALEAKRSEKAPIYAAIDTLPEGEQKNAIRTILERAHSDAKTKGVTGSANILANMKETLNGEPKGLFSKTEAQKALAVIEKAEGIAKGREGSNADVFLKGSVWKAQKKAADDAKAAEQRTRLFGTTNMHYGDTISIAPADSRKNATLVVMSTTFANGGHFDGKVVNDIFAKLVGEDGSPLQPPYSNGLLRELYNAEATKVAAKDQNAANAFQAAISILTLENQFAAERAAGQTSHKLFASNDALRAFNRNAFAKAGTYAEGDLTVAPVTSDVPLQGDSQGGPVDSGTVARGSNKVILYSLKHGTRLGFDTDIVPAPNPDEVPQFTSVEQVKELQRSLGVLEDGMYGPLTHAAMVAKAKAVNESKKPKDYNFTLEGVLASFVDAISKLLGGGQSRTAAPAANLDQLKATLTQIAGGLKDTNGNALSEDDLDLRTTAETKKAVADKMNMDLNNPIQALAVDAAISTKNDEVLAGILSATIKKISDGLKANKVSDANIQAITKPGAITIDKEGRIHSSFIQTIETLAGYNNPNDTLGSNSAALLDSQSSQGLAAIAGAINNGTLKVVAEASAPSGAGASGSGQGTGR